MSRSSRRRAQVEPTAALAAVAALAVVLAAYGGAYRAAQPDVSSDDAPTVLARVLGAVSTGGVVQPSSLRDLAAVQTRDRRANVTIRAAGRVWHVGPATPARTGGGGSRAAVDVATRSVAVAFPSGRVRPGRLRVVVW